LFFIGALGLWDQTMTTLAIIVTSVGVSVLIGIPIGIIAAKNDRFEASLRPLLDGMQTMPSFVYLIPAVFFFGIGKVPAVVATVVYAVPPCIRLTNLGIRQVASDVVEAGHSFGATASQILFKIQLPLARPSIMAGVNQTIMMALAMVVIASMIGAAGLGLEVLRGIERLDVGRGFVAGISIVVVAIMIDRVSQALGKMQTTRRMSK
jgi:glycine betaine/proline transport system permease protein